MATISEHNLGDKLLEEFDNQQWKFFNINQNPGLLDESNNNYFFAKTDEHTNSEYKCFKNKVMIETVDGRQHNAHIIHWAKSGGWGCITFSEFWDQFNEKGELLG